MKKKLKRKQTFLEHAEISPLMHDYPLLSAKQPGADTDQQKGKVNGAMNVRSDAEGAECRNLL